MIHAIKHLAKLRQAASQVLTVALISDLEMKASPPKKRQWEEEIFRFYRKGKGRHHLTP